MEKVAEGGVGGRGDNGGGLWEEGKIGSVYIEKFA